MQLPVKGHKELRDKPMPALAHPLLASAKDPFKAIARKDVLLHFPYHDFGQFTELLHKSAMDRNVEHIAITLYRVAEGSSVCSELLLALRNGKRVTVFVEVQARFDERSNLQWGEALEKAGAKVLYSHEGLKVHCKLCLIERREKGRIRRYAYLGTGNFNERTSRIYSDLGLLTCHQGMVDDVAEVFAYLGDRRLQPRPVHLLIAPLLLRSQLESLVDKEIENALRGLPAEIQLKLNSLEDPAMISKLYDANMAGVKVRLIIRGICCLVTGVDRLSRGIKAISIVDRYLEHARVYVFHNAGDPKVYLSSADWMERNLDRRVEVAFPVLDPALHAEVLDVLAMQWKDERKARIIDREQRNRYKRAKRDGKGFQAQPATYRYLRAKVGRAVAV
jgi:polyphosphate kinase